MGWWILVVSFGMVVSTLGSRWPPSFLSVCRVWGQTLTFLPRLSGFHLFLRPSYYPSSVDCSDLVLPVQPILGARLILCRYLVVAVFRGSSLRFPFSRGIKRYLSLYSVSAVSRPTFLCYHPSTFLQSKWHSDVIAVDPSGVSWLVYPSGVWGVSSVVTGR